ncbi:TonB-dependent receptor [Aquabacterium sp. OR-4]|uniref:TonB-dependent receptor n=1 Tax=Aquabacterium sp. OR-4 TaxID=2978127 RepID=UPI0021B40D4B|nr:TonB-dependent receptor [Aquabacterium sp. OR-4]MDT7838218.1 TonB-dependent receptor [Aquabacterium sp. OR-4]
MAAAALLACAAAGDMAWAQATPPAAVQAVVITGQAEATDRALREQAAADSVISVVRADGIGRLPDKNAAEALQRVPGVSIERDQGEGRYVRVRGLGPDLNAVTLNGALVPAPEAGRRAVALDVLPSSLVRALVVHKTLTPDMDANSLGGTIDVQTLSAFDQPGRFLSAELGASRDSLTGRTRPNAALAWSERFDGGRLGLALGLSHEERAFGSDNVETGGAWDGDALAEFERRAYRITRKRSGLAANLEYRPTALQQWFARATYSRFSDLEQRQAHAIAFDEAQAAGATGEAESVRELKDRLETQTIRAFSLGGDWRLGAAASDWRVQGELGQSQAREKLPQRIAAAVFEADDVFSGVGFTNARAPSLVAPAAIHRAASYLLTEIEAERSLAIDRERHARLDFSRGFALAGHEAELKFGAKTSHRRKTNEQTTWKLEDLDEAPLALSDAQRSLSALNLGQAAYGLGEFGPAIASAPILAMLGRVNLDDFIDDEESRLATMTLRERIDAGYLQGKLDLGATHLLAGLRMERTRLRTEGWALVDGEFTPTRVDSRHSHWLPGLHLRHDLDRATSLRAAWTNSVVRPTFEQLSPARLVDGDEAEFGNPLLQPLRARNLDLGLERQLGYAGAVSAYAFHKQIRNFVYQTDVAGSGDWADFSEAITYANGRSARVSGLELAWSRSWRELPGPWNALVTAANATLSHSKARIAAMDDGSRVERSIPLPSQSSRVLNLMLGWETPGLGLRLAANHKSRYLLEVGDARAADADLYVAPQTQWDVSARFNLAKDTALVVEGLNLTNQAYEVLQGRSSRNAQYERYGRSLRVSVKMALF